MKKFLVALVALVAAAVGASAQQLQIGYGGYTQMDNSDMHDGGKINNAWGALTAGVNFDVMPKMKLGVSYTFSSASFKHADDVHAYYHVIMANAFYRYYSNSIVRLYAHLGIGADITHIAWDGDSKDKGYFAFQISPLGAEVGLSPKTAIFAELGYGAQGLLQAGVRFNF